MSLLTRATVRAFTIAVAAVMPLQAIESHGAETNLALETTGSQIHWRSGSESVQHLSASAAAQAIAELCPAGARRHVVVQFDQQPSDQTALQAAGLTLLHYLGSCAYFATVQDPDLEALSKTGSLRFAAPINITQKMHPKLTAREVPQWVIVGRTTPSDRSGSRVWEPIVVVCVLFHRDVPVIPNGRRIAQRHGGIVQSTLKTVNGAVIRMPKSKLPILAGDDGVQWIEYPLPALEPNNDGNRARTQADVVQLPPYDLDGRGVSVLVFDGGIARETHVDFGGRLTARDPGLPHFHATHVAGTIGGDGSASGGVHAGMAPGVKIESYEFIPEFGLAAGFLYTDPGDIEADYAEAIGLYAVDVANNSIGTNLAANGFDCDWEGDYGTTSVVIDSIVAGELGAPFRIVWSNGNERGDGRCGTEYHTTAPPACAKNHITVGALNSNDDSVTAFTSWGPADDGRLKPDLCAPGCQSDGDLGVTSTWHTDDTAYDTICGTSMSGPTVTGLCALLMQDIRTRFPGHADPRNSTLKVLLAHNAKDIAAIGPDYQTGFGSVRIKDTIDFVATGNYTEDTVSQGTSFTMTAVVGIGTPSLKATLAWDDPAGTPNVVPALVNDLDLRVFSPSGARYYPWTLGGLADPGAPAARNTEDHTNNIEQVVVDNPEPGKWAIEVRGFDVPFGPQVFSLAVSPDLAFDCNGNMIDDGCDLSCGIANGTCDVPGCGLSQDCTGNGIPDECEPDCDGNGIADSCDIASGARDCNVNGFLDHCDIASGRSRDCNLNSIPDDCEENDCNRNTNPDDCDIAMGLSGDCDSDGIPDECDIACCRAGNCTMGTQPDCEGLICDVEEFLPGAFVGCFGDVDGDGTVNAVDRGFVSANIGAADPISLCLFDLDDDGIIDERDREIVSLHFGECHPLPSYQDGSGLRIDGTRDLRFGGGLVMAPCEDCESILCEPFGACCADSGDCTLEHESRCEGFICKVAELLPPTFAGCLGDANGDGVVDTEDREIVALYYGETDPLFVCLYDLNGDGVINPIDRAFVSANIGECATLPDHQDGSGLNGGMPDTRFNRTFQGPGTTCTPDPCGSPCGLMGDINGDGRVDGKDVAGFVRAKTGEPPEPNENPACADYGSGEMMGDAQIFVADILNG